MEILAIHANTDLRVQPPTARPAGAHVYHVNCRQFSVVHRAWQQKSASNPAALAVMTLDLERIWMTPAESDQVLAAIKGMQNPLALNTETAADNQ